MHADCIPNINTKKRPSKVSGVNIQFSSISLFATLENFKITKLIIFD
jgi:hypothetical protein